MTSLNRSNFKVLPLTQGKALILGGKTLDEFNASLEIVDLSTLAVSDTETALPCRFTCLSAAKCSKFIYIAGNSAVDNTDDADEGNLSFDSGDSVKPNSTGEVMKFMSLDLERKLWKEL